MKKKQFGLVMLWLILGVPLIIFKPILHAKEIKATTETGKKVILFPDGTWKYEANRNKQRAQDIENKPISPSLEAIDNFGSDYIGKKVVVVAPFYSLDQYSVRFLPSSLKSKGLIGFGVYKKNSGAFIDCFASKNFKNLLLSLRLNQHIRMTGEIFEYSHSFGKRFGFLVEDIEIVSN